MGLDEELSSSEKDDSSNKPPIEKVVDDATIENGSEKEDSGSASMEIHERRTNGNTVVSEQDYSIEQNFLSKICFSHGMALAALEMPLPAMVQVADVTKVDGKINTLELCDGKLTTSQLARNMSFSVMTRHEVSKYSVIKIGSVSFGYSSIAEDREHFQKLLEKSTFNNRDSYAFMVLEDITVIEEGSKIGHLLWDEQNLGCGYSSGEHEQTEDSRAGMNSNLMFLYIHIP